MKITATAAALIMWLYKNALNHTLNTPTAQHPIIPASQEEQKVDILIDHEKDRSGTLNKAFFYIGKMVSRKCVNLRDG